MPFSKHHDVFIVHALVFVANRCDVVYFVRIICSVMFGLSFSFFWFVESTLAFAFEWLCWVAFRVHTFNSKYATCLFNSIHFYLLMQFLMLILFICSCHFMMHHLIFICAFCVF